MRVRPTLRESLGMQSRLAADCSVGNGTLLVSTELQRIVDSCAVSYWFLLKVIQI